MASGEPQPIAPADIESKQLVRRHLATSDLWLTLVATQVAEKGWFVMYTLRPRSWSVAAVAFLAFAGTAAAQTPSSAVLNTLEVRRLVGSADTGDQARLASHFSALAERYEAQARRHTAMARAFTGNPNRQMATGWAAHCERLAKLDTQSAGIVRELAAHHQRLATGNASVAPQGGSSFEAGAGALTPSDEDLVALAARARTPGDHRVLEEYFVTLEKKSTADVAEHVAMANTYRGTRIAWAAVHCDQLAKRARESAQRAKEAASMHGRLAAASL